MSNSDTNKYPLLGEVLKILGLPLQALYSTRDLAAIFSVSPRAMQARIAAGELKPRNLPGRGKFLAQDIEEYLETSRSKGCQ